MRKILPRPPAGCWFEQAKNEPFSPLPIVGEGWGEGLNWLKGLKGGRVERLDT